MSEMLFFSPTKIIHGNNTSLTVGREIKKLNFTKALIVSDNILVEAGLTKQVEQSLQDNKITYKLFSDVSVDPIIKEVHQGVEAAKSIGAQAIVVVGGGSAMCAGKAIALTFVNGGSIEDYKGANKASKPPLPVICLPTTSGSGSEVSPYFLITDPKDHIKMAFYSLEYHPYLTILDPQMLLTLPYRQAINSSVDALSHAIESLMSIKATPYTENIALGATKLIFENMIKAAATSSLENKELMLLASSMANIACGNSSLSLGHAASDGLYKLPHGLACGIMLPYVMRFNLPVMYEKMAEIAVLGGANVSGLSLKEKAFEGIKAVENLYKESGFDARIPEDIVPRTMMEEMVSRTAKAAMARLNIRQWNEKDLTGLFEAAYKGI